MIYLLIGYMWLFIHRPFEVWPWLAAYRVERVFMLATIAYWLVAADKTWIRSRSHFPVFLLAAVFAIAVGLSPYADFKYVEDWYKVLVFYLLVVTFVKTEKDLRTLIIAYVAVVALYELHSLREFMCGRYEWEMGTKRMIGVDVTMSDPNSFGPTVDYALPFLYPVWALARVRWQKLAVLGALALAVTCVILTGSRSSFAGLLLIATVATLASKHRKVLLVGLVVGLPLLWVNLRPDLQDRYMSTIDPSRGKGAAQGSAEGRTASFWDGMQSFAKNPLFGAGIGSYRAKTGFATHNVYNEAMGEMGLGGLAVLVGFAWAFFTNFVESRRLQGNADDPDEVFLYRVCAAAAASCVLLFFLGWAGHNLMRYNWLWFGAFSGIALMFLRRRAATEDTQQSTATEEALFDNPYAISEAP